MSYEDGAPGPDYSVAALVPLRFAPLGICKHDFGLTRASSEDSYICRRCGYTMTMRDIYNAMSQPDGLTKLVLGHWVDARDWEIASR